MRKLTIPLSALHLSKLLLPRCFSTLPNSLSTALPPPPPPPPPAPLRGLEFVSPRSFTLGAHFLCFFPVRHFSSNAHNATTSVSGSLEKIGEEEKSIAELLSNELQLSPGDAFRCVKFLKGLRVSERTIARVLETVPMVIMWSEDKVLSKFEFLMGIGIQMREIDRVIGLFPGILEFGVANRLKPLVDEFEALGFDLNEIRKEVLREPKVLGLENGELSQCVEMLRKLKCRVAIKEKIYRDGEFRAGYKVKLRVDCLRKHGLIYRDAFMVLWKEPRVILYEMKDIEKKIDFLVRKMRFEVRWLVEVPEYLGVNFEKQIVPRFNVIEYLRANDGLGDEVGLRDLVKLSRMRFYNMYVKPYPECENLYGRFAGDAVVRSRHPTGMWKLFRPPKYHESRDDVKNIKAYVESLS